MLYIIKSEIFAIIVLEKEAQTHQKAPRAQTQLKRQNSVFPYESDKLFKHTLSLSLFRIFKTPFYALIDISNFHTLQKKRTKKKKHELNSTKQKRVREIFNLSLKYYLQTTVLSHSNFF